MKMKPFISYEPIYLIYCAYFIRVTKDIFKILIFFEKLLDQTTFHVGKQIYIENMDNICLDNRVHAWEVMNFLFANHYQLSSEHIKQTESKFLPYPSGCIRLCIQLSLTKIL